MKNNIFLSFILLISLFTTSCYEIIDKKTSLEKETELYFHRNYFCFDFVKKCELEILKIKNLDTLIYVKTSQAHGNYKELHGKLSKINDSIFYVNPFKGFIQKGNRDKPFLNKKDTVFFYCDSSFIGNPLKIEYSNGEIEEFEISSKINKYKINEENFKKRRDYLYITFNHKNPIVDEEIEITSIYNNSKYSIVFEKIERLYGFYIIIKEDRVYSLNPSTKDYFSLGVKFNLLRMKEDFIFKKDRKIYE